MIERTVRQIGVYRNSPYVGAYRFTEEGDCLIVKPSTPILGLTGILSPPVLDESHDSNGGRFDVSFRYSLDEGLNWSETFSLSEIANIQVNFKKTHYFCLEFTIKKMGPGDSWFMGLDFEDSLSFEAPPIPDFYSSQKPLPGLPYYNHEAIQWALNVLEKVYKKGIVPSFISRGDNKDWKDEDYINLWWAILYPTALRIAYSEKFTDLLWEPELLKKYLEQRGLIIGNTSHLGEMFHLMSNFYDEETRRGTLSVFDRERAVLDGMPLRGEATRLVDYKRFSDLFLGLLNYYEQGWWIGSTSACGYRNVDNFENFRLAYENRFTSLSNYPLTENHSVITIEDGEMVITSSSNGYSGIGSNDLSKALPVTPEREYLIKIRFTLPTSERIRYRIKGYDDLDNPVDFMSIGGGIGEWTIEDDFEVQSYFEPNNLFNPGADYSILRAGTYTLVSLIRRADSPSSGTLDGLTGELRFRPNTPMTKIMPIFHVYASATIHEFGVYQFFEEETYLDSILRKSGTILIKNNNFEYTNSEIEKILRNKLLSSEIDTRIIIE